MARGRMINKKISNDKRVNDLPLQAQLLFTWLIPHLDCNGRFYGSAQMVKSLVVPRKNWSKNQIERWLSVMENSKNNDGDPLICRYTLEGEQYLFMPGFESEQIGLRKDKEKPEFPTFDGNNTEDVGQTVPLRGREGEVEVEQEVKQESVMNELINKESVLEVYKKEIAGLHEEESLREDVERDIEDAINIFSVAWVSDAIRVAIKQNGRTWGYIAKILKNWKRYGKEPRNKGSPKKQDPDKYIKGQYGHLVNR